jgi:hypothetical protein
MGLAAGEGIANGWYITHGRNAIAEGLQVGVGSIPRDLGRRRNGRGPASGRRATQS